MTVIYADIIFLLNTLVDYLVILVTGRLAGIPLQRKRFLSAALLGGLYAAAAAVPNLNLMRTVPAKLLVWILIALTAYGYSERFIRKTLLMGAVSGMLAGVVLALGNLFSQRLFIAYLPRVSRWMLLSGIFLCSLCSIAFRGCAQSRITGTTIPATLSIAGREVCFTALLDTGNQLRAAADGRPILVVSPEVLKAVLPPQWVSLMTEECLQHPVELLEWIHIEFQGISPGLIPYRALGVPSGTLLTLQTDWIIIQNEIYPHASVAVAPFDLGLGYSALWGGNLKGVSVKHDLFEQTPTVVAETVEQ